MKLLQGTFRDDRHGAEAVTPAKWPAAPTHLNDRERELWAQLEERCAPWVAESDWLALNGVVSLTDRILTIQAAMQATPDAGNPIQVTYTPSADGEPNAEAAPNPLYGMELKLWTALRGYIGITGLSPVDRAKVQRPGEEKPVNPLDRFIKKAK